MIQIKCIIEDRKKIQNYLGRNYPKVTTSNLTEKSTNFFTKKQISNAQAWNEIYKP